LLFLFLLVSPFLSLFPLLLVLVALNEEEMFESEALFGSCSSSVDCSGPSPKKPRKICFNPRRPSPLSTAAAGSGLALSVLSAAANWFGSAAVSAAQTQSVAASRRTADLWYRFIVIAICFCFACPMNSTKTTADGRKRRWTTTKENRENDGTA